MPVMVRCPNCKTLNMSIIQMSKTDLENMEMRNNIVKDCAQNCSDCNEMIKVENVDLVWQD